MGAERLDHGRQPTSPTRKEKGRLSRRPQSCSFSRQEGARERRINGSRTALRGAVSGRSVFNETARPASPAWRAALACGHRSHAAPGLGHDPQPVGDLCERKSRRRFASSCAGSRIAFHSAGLSSGRLKAGPGAALQASGKALSRGSRQSLHGFPGRMQRKRNATRDPAQDSAAKRRRIMEAPVGPSFAPAAPDPQRRPSTSRSVLRHDALRRAT